LDLKKLDERFPIEELEDRIRRLEKSIDLLNEQLDKFYLG